MFIIPAIGVVLVVAGLVLRSRSKATPANASAPARLPSNSGTFVAIAGVVVLALGLLATITHATTTATHDPELAVGNCVTSSEYRSAQIGKIHPADCADHAAVYELAAAVTNGATCPDGKLKDAAYFVLTDGNHSLCFAPNVKVGDCFSMQADVNQITPVDCATKNGAGVTAQVGARFDGSTDTAQCAMPAGATVTPKPARVVCWQPVGASS
ncbi:hypothetical protein ACFXHA_39020 [Nocardia sp. NPDC059240]|uniref:LppU/SCO3897 family protein n=1 Tax=Nocardia sp. NPDC059240 TaxID=3346786 RepID=UPI00367476EB